MTSMSLPATHEILDATEHLPGGATLVVSQVAWDDYERVLEGLAERPRLRVSYDCGRLEIVSPSREHETTERLIEDLVLLYCQTFHVELEKFGHTTWKHPGLEKGVEVDACYCIRDPQRGARRESSGLGPDSPPDIAVEIDVTSGSLKKFPIYAALSVPEIWWYDGTSFRFYQLVEAAYVETTNSHFLPKLTGSMLTESIQIKKTQGQPEAREAFLRLIQALK